MRETRPANPGSAIMTATSFDGLHAATRDQASRGSSWFVRVGTLDEPSRLTPDVQIYTRSKLPWVALPAGVPAFEAYYDSKKLWPPESLERRKAIFG